MRTYLTLSAILVIAITLLAGCCKEDKGLQPPSYSMTATIQRPDNSVINFTALGGRYVVATDNGRVCVIAANDTAKNAVVSNITFSIYYYGSETYYIDNTYTSGFYEAINPVYSQTAFNDGYVTIASTTGEVITGYFSGHLTDGSSISGTFTAAGKGFW